MKGVGIVWSDHHVHLCCEYEVIVSDMTAFKVKDVFYKLTMYFDAWNKEIVGYGLVSCKGDTRSYHDGLNQVLDKIKEEQIKEPIILYSNQGTVYSSKI